MAPGTGSAESGGRRSGAVSLNRSALRRSHGMTEEQAATGDATPIESGTVVYDEDGARLGVISGFTDDGFEVAITEDVEDVDESGRAAVGAPDTESEQARKTSESSLRTSEQEQQPGQEFGEGYLMWRCQECGEMGELEEGLPQECPNCGASEVARFRED